VSPITLPTGEVVYDPTGVVAVAEQPRAPRASRLQGLRVGVLDNSKWNAGVLLRKTVELLEQTDGPLGEVSFAKKASFSSNAAPGVLRQLADRSDVVVTAIGD
jgi:hypothetical protein